MVASNPEHGIADSADTELPLGFRIEARHDDRYEPAPVVFDVFRGERRVAWSLRTRDAAVRWAWRVAGLPAAAPSAPIARRASASPWWAEAS